MTGFFFEAASQKALGESKVPDTELGGDRLTIAKALLNVISSTRDHTPPPFTTDPHFFTTTGYSLYYKPSLPPAVHLYQQTGRKR